VIFCLFGLLLLLFGGTEGILLFSFVIVVVFVGPGFELRALGFESKPSQIKHSTARATSPFCFGYFGDAIS
jgi:hypothetical protein